MKTKDLFLILLFALAGYFVIVKMRGIPTVGTAGANMQGGMLPAGSSQSVTQGVVNAANSILSALGSFAQTTPKTT